MIELFAFVALVLAFAAFMSGHATSARLDRRIDELKAELKRIEENGLVPARIATATPDPAREVAQVVSEETAVPFAASADDAALRQQAVEKASRGEPAAARTEPAKAIDAVVPRRAETLESRLGARWAVWVGGIALALGGVFMVKYSIDAGLVSPAVRLFIATFLGIGMIAVGEIVRRRALPFTVGAFRNAMIPGVLTAAGAVTLFGVVFAAHGVYGYIGPAPAFVLLAVLSLAIIGLSLLHGQAFAGLGLFASLVTPLLVSSQSPSPWSLFGFLSIVWLACLAASRLRGWRGVPSAANLGLCLWALLYMGNTDGFQTLPVTLTMLVMIAGVGFLWPGVSLLQKPKENPAPEAAASPVPGRMPVVVVPAWQRLLSPREAAITLSAALSAAVTALVMISPGLTPSGTPVSSYFVIVVALAGLGAWSLRAVYPATLSALAAMAGVSSLTAFSDTTLPYATSDGMVVRSVVTAATAMTVAMLLSVVFVALGAFAIRRHLKTAPALSTLWAAIAAAVAFGLTTLSFVMTGNLAFDAPHGFFALAIGVVLLALAEIMPREDALPSVFEPDVFEPSRACLVTGSLAMFVLSLHALTNGLATTVLVAVLGGAFVAATRLRPWPVLPWMMVAAALVVLVRIAIDPTIVGVDHLGRMPVFNALLPGYGLPALILIASAFELRATPDLRLRNLLQGLASLFALLTLAILVRHAMNGGVLDAATPTLGEQSIYTLLAIGASGILMTLDAKAPSAVFRIGSMALGAVSMLFILTAHLGGLNPYFTGENLGALPVLDLLLIAYLLPAIAFAALASYARGRRPMGYVYALAVTGAGLAFAFATLSVRRFWQGQNIVDWKGFLPAETYTYSVVWLLLGVLLLALGSRFNAKSIRIASAVLVFVAVIKVFLIDMANLEGFLRALSFIGLGGVLIGIGLFYQKILSSAADPDPEPVTDPSSADSMPDTTTSSA